MGNLKGMEMKRFVNCETTVFGKLQTSLDGRERRKLSAFSDVIGS